MTGQEELAEIMDKEIYRQNYETITNKLLFTYLPYKTVVDGIGNIISGGYQYLNILYIQLLI